LRRWAPGAEPTWRVDHVRGGASALHQASADLVSVGDAGRVIRVLEAEAPAVVLGSAQPDAHIDRGRAAARGVAVARRRSGGAAVLVGPGVALWIDVIVPAGDPLWRADVGRAGAWLGACWAGALAEVGMLDAQVQAGAMIRSAWSGWVCFAGLAPGEVTVGSAKVVGISQRRTRWATLFQCAVPLGAWDGEAVTRWDPAALLDVLALSAGQRSKGVVELAGAAVTVADGAGLAEAMIDRCRHAQPR